MLACERADKQLHQVGVMKNFLNSRDQKTIERARFCAVTKRGGTVEPAGADVVRCCALLNTFITACCNFTICACCVWSAANSAMIDGSGRTDTRCCNFRRKFTAQQQEILECSPSALRSDTATN
eukprot:scaffold490941_cov37-Prasinocladus_malaysianus.AAC.1